MSDTTVTLRTPRSLSRANPYWVIATHVAGLAIRGAAIWGVVFGIWVFATVKTFTSECPTLAERQQLAGSLQAFSTLMGLPRHAETVAGFTSWRVLVVTVIIGAIWGLQTSTGLLRGEEDAGRWELLLAGQTTKRRGTMQALIGLYVAWVAMLILAGLFTIAAGRSPGAHFGLVGSLLFAFGLVSGAAMFLAIGAVVSQVAATRGQATTIASAVLGVAYVVRMIADSRSSLGWLRWLSPIGWVEELRPLQNPQPLALAPMIGLVIVCGGLAVVLAGARDLNASVLRERAPGRDKARLLLGPFSLALRLTGPNGAAWLAGVVGMALVYGSLTRSATNILASSPSMLATLGRLGVRRVTEGYLGVVFLLVDVLIAVIAASQVAAIRDEEAAGRLDNLLVRPVSRVSWLIGRLVVSTFLIILSGLVAGFFTWLGVASQHLYVAQPRLLEAGINATVPGVFVLGVGVLVLGLRPRLSARVAYGIVAWSFLIDLLASLFKRAQWLRDSSLFTHIELAPAAKPDWTTAAIIVLLGVAAAALGLLAFSRRDIEYS